MSKCRIGTVLLLLALLAPAAGAIEFGIPADGKDLVKLTDGRVLACVYAEDGQEVVLGFDGEQIRIPKDRVEEVRYFRDFDPEPHDAEEQKKVDEGLVRWKGRWLEPDLVAKLREKELADLREQRADDEAHALWENRRTLETKHFEIQSNIDKANLDFYAESLEEHYEAFTKAFHIRLTQRERRKKLPVFIFRGREEYWTFKEAGGGGNAENTLGYFVPVMGEEKLVFFDQPGGRRETLDVMFHEGTHFLLHLAEPQVLLPRWLHEGMAEYFGSAELVDGKFRVGRVQDGRLLNFQEMIRRNRTVPWDEMFRAGNPAEEGKHVDFEAPHYAQAWSFVYFLLTYKDGRYAGRFVDYINRAVTGRGGVKYTPIASTERRFLDPDQDRELLLRCLKLKSLDQIQDEFFEFINQVPLERPDAYVERAQTRYWVDRDEKGADEDFQTALKEGGDDPKVLYELADAYLRIPGRRGQGLEFMKKAVELAPLNTRYRYYWARMIDPPENLRQLKLCVAIDPDDPDSVGEYAWQRYQSEVKAYYRVESDNDKRVAAESIELVKHAIELDPVHYHLDTLAALYLVTGEFGKARDCAERAVQQEPENTVYLRRAALSCAMAGDAAKFVRTLRRLKLVLARPDEDTGATPPERVIEERIDDALEDAAGYAIAWKKVDLGLKALEAWYGGSAPETEHGIWVWADLLNEAGQTEKAMKVAEEGLKDYPASVRIRRLLAAMKGEDE